MLREKVALFNFLYWSYEMAKQCPKHGWVDSDWVECKTCGMCADSKRKE